MIAAIVTGIVVTVLSFLLIYACLVAGARAEQEGEINGIVGRKP